MSKQFLVNIDLNKNELQNARIQNLASAPGTPVAGQVYHDTTNNATYVYNGSAWRPVDAAKLTDGTIANTALATNPLARANHTGTQVASTISDFNTAVRTNTLNQMAVPTAAVAMNNQKITGLAAPSASTDAATMGYVDSAVAGLSWKEAVRAASTANVAALSAPQTIDTVSLIAGDRVLVKAQSTASANGIYVVAAGAWTRATDADSQDDLRGMAVMVEEGSQAGSQWVITTDGTITVGTTALTFAQFGGGNTYTAGNGLTLAANDFNVGAGTGIVVAADTVSIDTAVVPIKYATNVGDGSTTAITVTHNLGTLDVVVCVFANTGGAEVMCDVTHVSTNTISLAFSVAPAAAAYRCVVHG